MDKQMLIEKLESAENEADVENIFAARGITEAEEKKSLLLECKGLQSFYSPGYWNLSIEEQYQHELAIFLNGKWKVKKIYAKLN